MKVLVEEPYYKNNVHVARFYTNDNKIQCLTWQCLHTISNGECILCALSVETDED